MGLIIVVLNYKGERHSETEGEHSEVSDGHLHLQLSKRRSANGSRLQSSPPFKDSVIA